MELTAALEASTLQERIRLASFAAASQALDVSLKKQQRIVAGEIRGADSITSVPYGVQLALSSRRLHAMRELLLHAITTHTAYLRLTHCCRTSTNTTSHSAAASLHSSMM